MTAFLIIVAVFASVMWAAWVGANKLADWLEGLR